MTGTRTDRTAMSTTIVPDRVDEVERVPRHRNAYDEDCDDGPKFAQGFRHVL